MTIIGTLSTGLNIEGSLSSVTVEGVLTIPSEKPVEEYAGSYEVTPTSEVQTLATKKKWLTEDIKINPIPSNYGLITWNGSTITVS